MGGDTKLHSYTLFLDILGYSHKINHVQNDEEANKIFSLLELIEKLITEYRSLASSNDAYKEYELHHSFFSDAIVLSFTPKENLKISSAELIFFNQTTLEFIFTWVMNIQIAVLFETGLLLRGGISTKNIFWKDNKVIGPGLIEAYQLEQNEAKHPRIILSKELSKDTELINLINSVNSGGDSAYHKHTLLRKDNDIYYYNLVGRLLARIVYDSEVPNDVVDDVMAVTHKYLLVQKSTIEHFISESNAKYVDKYEWLKEDHNLSITEFVHDNDLNLEGFKQYLIQ